MPGYAGFDSSEYPGLAHMNWLIGNTNLRWCGFYLGQTPSHPSTSWMRSRAELAQLNWGFAPIYVGQQVTGPGSHNVTLAQGALDGADACRLMGQSGFQPGTYVYLDLENGQPFTDDQKKYVAAWVDAVKANNFLPGVYCSWTFAADMHQLRSQARVWVFRVSTTKPHPVPGANFPDPHPAGCGYAGAYAWQLGMECQISVPGAPNGILQVDLDSAASPDPSR